jgi:hypothetical protein
VSFAAITFCVASQRVFIVVSVYFVTTQSGNFWIHPRMVTTGEIGHDHHLRHPRLFAKVKNTWNSASILPYVFMDLHYFVAT